MNEELQKIIDKAIESKDKDDAIRSRIQQINDHIAELENEKKLLVRHLDSGFFVPQWKIDLENLIEAEIAKRREDK